MDLSGSHWFGILAVLVLVLLNGFFVAAEFSLVAVRKTRVEQLVNEGNRAARGVQKALGHLDTYIAATQLGITMASLALGFIGEPALAGLFEPLFTRILPPLGAKATAHGVSIGVAFAIATALHIVLGELAPKSIALQRTDATALWVTGALDLFLKVFRPFIYLLNATGNLVVRMLGLRAVTERAGVHSVEELELLVRSSREAGLMEEQQEHIVTGAFHVEETPVRRVMTPRLDIVALPSDAGIGDLVRLMTESGHQRLPVYEGSLDGITGIVHIKDVLKALAEPTPPAGIEGLCQPPYYVPETKRVSELLAELRRNERQMAIVRDEYGTVSGIATIEDLLEEIVGDIRDVGDAAEGPCITQVDELTCLVDGRMSLDDFAERMGADLPLEEADSVGGFVFGLLGQQPSKGDRTRWGELEFCVEVTDGRRIQKLQVVRLHGHSKGEEA